MPVPEGCPAAVRAFYQKNCVASARFILEEPIRTAWHAQHRFRIEEKGCIDERMLDAHKAKGLLVGITEFYRSAGGKSDLGSYAHARRCLDSNRKARGVMVDGVQHPMVVLRFNTAHFSASRPKNASCAAWQHDTKKALRFMQRSADEFNFAFAGTAVSIPLLHDTDLDAITVIGPDGRLDVRDLLKDPGTQNGSSVSIVIDRLREIFPRTWEPLTKLDPVYREAFHTELTECVVANLAFVRDVIASGRPVELLDHQGRIVFVGRHADWIEQSNTAFLVDDTDKRSRVLTGFEIALRYVAKNTILDALAAGDADWLVPVVINIPHDDDDHALTLVYTRRCEQMLKQKLRQCAPRVVEWLREVGVPHGTLTPLFNAALDDFVSRVSFSKSVSHRRTRLFVRIE